MFGHVSVCSLAAWYRNPRKGRAEEEKGYIKGALGCYPRTLPSSITVDSKEKPPDFP
jgi:hypothetical protein